MARRLHSSRFIKSFLTGYNVSQRATLEVWACIHCPGWTHTRHEARRTHEHFLPLIVVQTNRDFVIFEHSDTINLHVHKSEENQVHDLCNIHVELRLHVHISELSDHQTSTDNF